MSKRNLSPPYSEEFEASLLGSILIDNSQLYYIKDIVSSSDFFVKKNAKLFEILCDMDSRGIPVEIVTVVERLKELGVYEEIGGIEYLDSLMNAVAAASNARYYAQKVRDKAILRRLIKTCDSIMQRAYSQEEEPHAILEYSRSVIFDLTIESSDRDIISLDEAVKSSFHLIDNMYLKKSGFMGVPSGFTDLDKLTSGFQKSDLIILASRPSMGKTALALNIAMHASIDYEIPVLFISLEMSVEQLTMRLLCSQAKVPFSKLRKGALDQDEITRIMGAANILAESNNIFFIETSFLTLETLTAKVLRAVSEYKIGLIILDYLQLMGGGKEQPSEREKFVSQISRGLKQLAKKTHLPIIALAQLNREVEKRNPPRPRLSDLRESGAIEQDADLVLLLYRPEYYFKDRPEFHRVAELEIAKHRNGPLGKVELVFFQEFMTFENRAIDYEELPET